MRDEKRRGRDEEAVCVPKKRRSDDSPSGMSNQGHNLTASKPRSHVPMSERQQFALLRQMETEEVNQDKGDLGIDESGDGPRGASVRDLDATGDSIPVKDPDNTHPGQHHHHHHSTRDRSGAVMLTHAVSEKTSVRNSSTIQSALMHLIKTGDLDTLKQLVREGANVNEQDEHGWTALHEFSSRNLSRLVAYLLRHGARVELVDRSGDTALHAAARGNHARVIRTLLRHGADPMLKNARGERPSDLCPDTESSVILSQVHGRSFPPRMAYDYNN
ncbi:putative ankyrin repeat domain protein [Fasciola hepatica]|uniref:Ankyrin repeat domain protein n=1 Tax=Fasciola hepatica TaxID=6192 RepID=A0A4E0QUJ8_FASHE|nr:putative ankyrin repeat domain protein [Fasciola hepatica]